MTQFIQQYMPEITMVAAILLPLMPTIHRSHYVR